MKAYEIPRAKSRTIIGWDCVYIYIYIQERKKLM